MLCRGCRGSSSPLSLRGLKGATPMDNLFIYLFIIIGSVYISGLEYNRLEGLEDFFLYRIFKMYFFILLGFSS